MLKATAIAHPNIALAKYWGKSDIGRNMPAVPSLSLTLAGMATRTEVHFDPQLTADALELDGAPQHGRPLERVQQLLDLVAGTTRDRACVRSQNDFPTAAGLASSAAAFAALAVAANGALNAGHDRAALSCMARQVSASAGRSLFGGFVVLPAGRAGQTTLPALPLASPEHWDLVMVVAVTAEGPKKIGSTEGMILTTETSPLYEGWVRGAPAIFDRIREAVLARDLEALGPAVEESTLTMHATALAAQPGILYWNGASVEVMHAVRALRARGVPAYFTMDAGPHVKVLTLRQHLQEVVAGLNRVEGVLRTIVAQPGEGARLSDAAS